MKGYEHAAQAASNAASQLQAPHADQPPGGGMGSRKQNDKNIHKGRRQMDDSFMMYLYKIKLCTRQTTHNWKLCPWAHPGETAALRRHPNCHSAELCAAVRLNQECPHGETCSNSRNAFECWLHPDRYRTTMCSMGEACSRNICFFAHTADELRQPAATSFKPCQPLRVQAQQATHQQQQLAAAAAAAGGVPMRQGPNSGASGTLQGLVRAAADGYCSHGGTNAAAASTLHLLPHQQASGASAAAVQLVRRSAVDLSEYAAAQEYGYMGSSVAGVGTSCLYSAGTGTSPGYSAGMGMSCGSSSTTRATAVATGAFTSAAAAAILMPKARAGFVDGVQNMHAMQLAALAKQHQLQLVEQQKEHEKEMCMLQMIALKEQQDNVMHLQGVQDRETAALVHWMQGAKIDDGTTSLLWWQQQQPPVATAGGTGAEARQQQQAYVCYGLETAMGTSVAAGNPAVPLAHIPQLGGSVSQLCPQGPEAGPG